MPTTKTRFIIYIAIAVVAAVLIGYFAVSAIGKANNSPAKLLSLGEKYLLELNYEQALVQFLKVIEIEPMNERAYLAAAEAYVGLGQTDKAIGILEQGLAALADSAAIKAKLEELKSLPEPEPISEAKPEAEPVIDFTGYEPFTISDVEQMGLFYGMTIYDLNGCYNITSEIVSHQVEVIERNNDKRTNTTGRTNGYGNCSHGNEYANDRELRHFVIGVSPDNYLKVCGVGTFSEDDFPIAACQISWPRGMKLGMPITEVFEHFAIPGSKAQKFIQEPTRSNLISLGAEEDSYDDGVNYLRLRDSVPIVIDNKQYNIRSQIYIIDDSDSDFDVWFGCYKSEDYSQGIFISYESRNGIVERIYMDFKNWS